MSNSTRVLITPVFRMSYPNLLKARPFMRNGKPAGEPKFSVGGIFDPEDMGKFKTFDEGTGKFIDVSLPVVLVELAKAKWPGINVKEAVAAKELDWPIKNGDQLAQKAEAKKKSADHFVGKSIIQLSSSGEYPPNLYMRENGKRKQLARGLDADEKRAASLFVAGSYAYAEVNIKPQETPQGRFITFYLNSVSFSKPGERIGGQSMMDRFDGVEGGASDHDPTGGMDDEIPV
jgi:hypothetical protein